MSPTLSGAALGDLTAGTLTDHGLRIDGTVGVSGLAPRLRSTSRPLQGDGEALGAQRRNGAVIQARLTTGDPAKVRTLLVAADARPQPDDLLVLTLTDILYPGAWRCWVKPDNDPEYTFDQLAATDLQHTLDLAWVAPDSTLHSDAQTSHIFGTGSATDGMGTSPAGSFTFDATNLGGRAVVSGRAFELRITAHGTVVDPYIKIEGDADRTDEIVTWNRTLTSGQVLTTDANLTARVGSRHVSGVAESNGSPFLCWPRLRPGTQSIQVGCASGTISGYLKTRSTW